EGHGLDGWEPIGPTRTNQLEDRYVDTVDQGLGRAGFAARLRHGSGGTLLTLKSIASTGSGALHRREELEGPADPAYPPRDWPPSAARSLLLELAGDGPLVELVTVRQLRRVRPFRSADATIELSLDEVDVVAHGRIVRHFTELEAELREGEADSMSRLQGVLGAQPWLVPSTESKLRIALAAAGIGTAAGGGSAGGVLAGGGHGAGRGGVPAPAGLRREDDPVHDEGTTMTEAEARAEAELRAAEAELERAGGELERIAADLERAEAELAEAGAAEAERADAGAAEAEGPDAPADEPLGAGDLGNDGEEGTATTGEATASDADAGGAAEATEPAEPSAPAPLVVGKTPGVRADDTLAEAGRKVLRFHLARMLAREPGTRKGADPEELHGMRVATRRMRAAWRVFGEAYRPRRQRRYVRDLRDVAARLGAVRDLDVLIDELEDYTKALPEAERPHITPLLDAWRHQRDDARALLVRTLDTADYGRFVEEYREFVRTEGVGVQSVGPAEPHRVRDRMPALIWSAYEQVRAYEPILRWADVETLHALRIAAKRLRYTIEFVREPLGPEATPLVERVVALQDILGALHDADVAAGLARQFLVDRAAALSEQQTAAIGRFLVDRERERGRLRRSLGVPWRRVAGLAFRRAL
ncbi:MAG TPA: CHAD domain-containing protein, partial [Candidatus Dormibacteraeota bacterium]|nr:CHAD domain-containing protein [Candidatus Dormibacteraeota bacterium]